MSKDAAPVMRKLMPARGRVVLKSHKLSTLIALPDGTLKKNRGEIIAIHPDDAEKPLASCEEINYAKIGYLPRMNTMHEYKVGDIVWVQKLIGWNIEVGGEEIFVVEVKDILGKEISE